MIMKGSFSSKFSIKTYRNVAGPHCRGDSNDNISFYEKNMENYSSVTIMILSFWTDRAGQTV